MKSLGDCEAKARLIRQSCRRTALACRNQTWSNGRRQIVCALDRPQPGLAHEGAKLGEAVPLKQLTGAAPAGARASQTVSGGAACVYCERAGHGPNSDGPGVGCGAK